MGTGYLASDYTLSSLICLVFFFILYLADVGVV